MSNLIIDQTSKLEIPLTQQIFTDLIGNSNTARLRKTYYAPPEVIDLSLKIQLDEERAKENLKVLSFNWFNMRESLLLAERRSWYNRQLRRWNRQTGNCQRRLTSVAIKALWTYIHVDLGPCNGWCGRLERKSRSRHQLSSHARALCPVHFRSAPAYHPQFLLQRQLRSFARRFELYVPSTGKYTWVWQCLLWWGQWSYR